jgi:hypothetical protein
VAPAFGAQRELPPIVAAPITRPPPIDPGPREERGEILEGGRRIGAERALVALAQVCPPPADLNRGQVILEEADGAARSARHVAAMLRRIGASGPSCLEVDGQPAPAAPPLPPPPMPAVPPPP